MVGYFQLKIYKIMLTTNHCCVGATYKEIYELISHHFRDTFLRIYIAKHFLRNLPQRLNQ